ncbi:MAG TPA: hypothetical protein VIE65_23790, partial [Methylobacter sp.]
ELSKVFHIHQIRPSESVKLELWQTALSSINIYNYSKVVKFYTKTKKRLRMNFSSDLDTERKSSPINKYLPIIGFTILIILLFASHINVNIGSNETVGGSTGKIESPNAK